jgi:magnesium transporter
MIDKIKKETADFKIFTAVYIINHSEQIIGVVGIHDLLMQNLDTPAYKFMIQNIIVGYLNTPVDIVFKKMLKYSLASIPVIDDERHILGIITLDDIASYILEKIGS